MPEVLLQVQLQVPLAPTRGQQPRHPDRLHGKQDDESEEVGKVVGEEELRGEDSGDNGGAEVPASCSGGEE